MTRPRGCQPGSEGLVYLPYLMGERTPIWDPAARGAFMGLSSRHTRAHLYRAILEGVAYAFRQIAEIAYGEMEDGNRAAITAIDGGSRSSSVATDPGGRARSAHPGRWRRERHSPGQRFSCRTRRGGCRLI